MLRELLFHRLNTACANAHTLSVHELALQVYFVAALGGDFRVAAGLTRDRAAFTAFTEFTHK